MRTRQQAAATFERRRLTNSEPLNQVSRIRSKNFIETKGALEMPMQVKAHRAASVKVIMLIDG